MNPIERIISFFAPVVCVKCGAEGYPLCQECSELLPEQPSVCFICGKAVNNYTTCPACYTKTKPTHVWVSTMYKDESKDLVGALKFDYQRQAADSIADLICGCLPYFNDEPLVTYVPTAPSRRRARGFDHSALIAIRIAKNYRWRCVPLLARSGNVRQLGAKRAVRKKQLEGIFRPINQKLIKDRNILLIDDVVTTGATLETCSKLLFKAGARCVNAAVFARTPIK